jgi:hypothetical protein
MSCFSGAASASVPIINEFVFNHNGTDDAEYVEIIGTPLTDYAGYTLLQTEGDSTVAGTVDTALELGMTDPNGFLCPGLLLQRIRKRYGDPVAGSGFQRLYRAGSRYRQ